MSWGTSLVMVCSRGLAPRAWLKAVMCCSTVWIGRRGRRRYRWHSGRSTMRISTAEIAGGGDCGGGRCYRQPDHQHRLNREDHGGRFLDSDILVGVATDFAGDFATSASDFANPAATLGSLTISGRKLPSKASHPADVANSHISAPQVGTVSLMNLADTSAPMIHVMKVTGTLKVSQSKLTSAPMFAPGTWNLPGTRPAIWQVLA